VKEEISKRFKENLGRVERLLSLYDTLGQVSGRGRRDVATLDVLRSAVVFLHATLEDFVRSILGWRLPDASPKYLDDIPLAGCARRSKFTLGELAQHRGRGVDDVIHDSVANHLLESSFNHPGELAAALVALGIIDPVVEPYRDSLGPMMKRRHWIVHRADRNELTGLGHHRTRSIDKGTVNGWLDAIRAFGDAVLERL
jgi:hypothetical protein